MKLKESYFVPEVGPFFIIPKSMIKSNPIKSDFYEQTILSDSCPINNADTYGEFKICNTDHYSYWKKIQKASSRLKIVDYDFYPRGRVVYNTKTNKYHIILDKCIQGENTIDLIIDEFKLPRKDVIIMSDEHYKCHRCNKNYVNIVENKD